MDQLLLLLLLKIVVVVWFDDCIIIEWFLLLKFVENHFLDMPITILKKLFFLGKKWIINEWNEKLFSKKTHEKYSNSLIVCVRVEEGKNRSWKLMKSIDLSMDGLCVFWVSQNVRRRRRWWHNDHNRCFRNSDVIATI